MLYVYSPETQVWAIAFSPFYLLSYCVLFVDFLSNA